MQRAWPDGGIRDATVVQQSRYLPQQLTARLIVCGLCCGHRNCMELSPLFHEDDEEIHAKRPTHEAHEIDRTRGVVKLFRRQGPEGGNVNCRQHDTLAETADNRVERQNPESGVYVGSMKERRSKGENAKSGYRQVTGRKCVDQPSADWKKNITTNPAGAVTIPAHVGVKF